MYELPKSVKIDDEFFKIRNDGDYRVILDVIAAINDVDLSEKEKAIVAIYIFFDDCTKIKNAESAIEEIKKFINCGDEEPSGKAKPILFDWEKDFKLIIAPINKELGTEVRAVPYLHWWTFVSAFFEIGECTFQNVVTIRSKKQKGKKLEKWEQEFARDNPEVVNLKIKTTTAEQNLIESLLN